ncbi:Fic family protein [uncultured Desulfuromonas sp.]|uniref:Fic family protein n=1 Tax=uncultured Desulfuromonas sp. TaxID=181013 RepID=UPI002AAAD552|nr:Fic family protein [uncultured Desulfuromonas sp.]
MTLENKIEQVDRQQQEINQLRPLGRESLLQLRDYYRIGLTYSSNAIEGNTLTESETKVVLEDGLTIGGKPLRDHLEAIGHGDAFNRVCTLSQGQTMDEHSILELHRLFYQRIDSDNAGRYRTKPVIITGTTYTPPPPSKVAAAMQEFTSQIPTQRENLHPVELAGWLHIRLANIHPFIDGNGRTARLLMNLALMQAGYPITIIPPVVRGDYIAALQASNSGNNAPFINLLSNMVWEAQREYLRLVQSLTEE